MYWNYLGTGSWLQWFVVQVFPEPAVVSLYLSVWDGFFTHEFIQFLCELLHVASICNSLWLWVNVNYHLLSSLNLPPSFTWSFSFGWHPIALALEQTMIFFFPSVKILHLTTIFWRAFGMTAFGMTWCPDKLWGIGLPREGQPTGQEWAGIAHPTGPSSQPTTRHMVGWDGDAHPGALLCS